LLIGTPVRCRETECYINDPYSESHSGFPVEGKLIRESTRERETHDLRTEAMLAPYPEISNSFADIIKTWHRVASDLEPVVDLFSTVTFHRSLHTEAQFLFLVQALEVYHARLFDSRAMPSEEHAARVEAVVATAPPAFQEWARRTLRAANYKYLDERLTDIFQKHASEAKRLFPDLPKLPEKIRYTRNYLTHYTGDPDSPRFLNTKEMVRVNWYLRIFIWICLLKEIGVSDKAVERLISRYGSTKFINL
jgi:hypothetical protein